MTLACPWHLGHGCVEEEIGLLQSVKGTMHPPTSPIKVATRFGYQDVIIRLDNHVSDFF